MKVDFTQLMIDSLKKWVKFTANDRKLWSSSWEFFACQSLKNVWSVNKIDSKSDLSEATKQFLIALIVLCSITAICKLATVLSFPATKVGITTGNYIITRGEEN